MLPAGLWSGLVLTVLVLFVLVCWRKKRKSNQTGKPHMCGCVSLSAWSSGGLQKRCPRSLQCAHIKATTTRHKLLHSHLSSVMITHHFLYCKRCLSALRMFRFGFMKEDHRINLVLDTSYHESSLAIFHCFFSILILLSTQAEWQWKPGL